jgi:hypothetical protein
MGWLFHFARGKTMPTSMTKEEIVKAIQQCATKLKRNPNMRDLRMLHSLTKQEIYKHFGCLGKALAAAGLEATGPGHRLPEATLLLDWAAAARKLGKVPSVNEYEDTGRFTIMPFHSRYRLWTNIPEAFRKFAREAKLEPEWRDVLAMKTTWIGRESRPKKAVGPKRFRRGPILQGRTIYGRPILLPELAHEPVNELGVVFVFGMLARRLGFVVHHLQAAFPDCEAVRETALGRWQRVRIEFEFESRNFLKHRHKKNGCDMIVCWRHNWPECPANIEVLELRTVLRKTIAPLQLE